MMLIFRILVALFALVLIGFGLIAMIAPTPFGFVIVLLGLFLLASVTPEFLKWLRKRWPWLERHLDTLQEKGPKWLARILVKSDPPHEEDEEEKDSPGEDEPSADSR